MGGTTLPGEAFLRQNVPGYAVIDPVEPVKLPLEARDFGIYGGFMVTWVYVIALGRGRAKGLPPPPILLTLVAFVGIMGIDGVNAFLYDMPALPHLYTPQLQLRLATGLLCGIAFAGILLPVVNFSLWRENDPRPIIGSWKQLLGGLGLLVVLFLMNESRIGLFLYPFAILSSAATVILIGLINVVFVLGVVQKEASAATWRQVLNPFAVGVVLAMVELGFLSLLRYSVMGTAILP